MQKITLSFREAEYNSFVNKLKDAEKKAQDFINNIRSICKMDLPNNIIQDLFGGNGDHTAKVLEENVREELNRASITSATVINQAIKGDLEKFYFLFNNRPQIDHEIFTLLEINGEQVRIKENAFEQAKENFTSYIKTERGKAAYEKHKALMDAVNDFIGFVPNATRLTIHNYIQHEEAGHLNYDNL